MRRAAEPGRARQRRVLALYGFGLAAATALGFGILNATTVAATVPTEARADLSVSVRIDCRSNDPGAAVHSGSPDYRPHGFDRRPPLVQARVFASLTGVTGRFPGLVTEVHSTPSPRTTIVAFREPNGAPRGALQYYRSSSDGWQLVHAWYC